MLECTINNKIINSGLTKVNFNKTKNNINQKYDCNTNKKCASYTTAQLNETNKSTANNITINNGTRIPVYASNSALAIFYVPCTSKNNENSLTNDELINILKSWGAESVTVVLSYNTSDNLSELKSIARSGRHIFISPNIFEWMLQDISFREWALLPIKEHLYHAMNGSGGLGFIIMESGTTLSYGNWKSEDAIKHEDETQSSVNVNHKRQNNVNLLYHCRKN